ncbi:Bug family tripartite tricarboxylate transporter substrate binding protein [Humitalea sp. 24SJ18S-53]|uniref:Bug family tripartite tricarboxylate transporter substrate binding protein n=1 Tax=Humitalea sp. 24SJ18S-53 TaxID=3422307 RepID=UPI003D67EC6D
MAHQDSRTIGTFGRRGLLGTAMAAGLLPLASARAQAWPTQSLRIVVPFAAGGAVDFVGRLVAQGLGERIGQSVVVENRTGAGGAIGAQFVARSAPDGYTLMMTPVTSFAMLAGLPNNNLNLDMDKDFSAVATIGAVPIVVAVHGSVPAANLAELVAYAKANPGRLSYASAGNGSTEHLAAELFALRAGIEMLHVPYRGGAPAMTDLIAGQVQVMFATLPNVMQNGSGVKVLAIAMPARSPVLQDVPTATEAGVVGFDVASVYGILAPAALPAAIRTRLSTEIVALVETPAVSVRLSQQGIIPTPLPAAESQALLRDEVVRWREVIERARITL